jgi:adenosylcobinamide-GDP ribazoletransferase
MIVPEAARVGGLLSDLLKDLTAACGLLTRLPVGRSGEPVDLASCVWAFPVVGGAVNAVGGLTYWLAHWFGASAMLAAVWALAVTMLATGALHDDGLADTADGFGGGASPERKLEIMRDSHIGCYGALALLLSVLVRVAAISAIGEPSHVMVAFCLAGMLGRGGILMLLLTLSPAREDGMGAAMGETRVGRAAIGIALAVVACLMAVGVKQAIAIVVFGFGVSLAMARLARVQIGGYTGDVLGAGEVVTECAVLTMAACGLAI